MVNQGIQHQIGIAIIKIFPLAFTSERSELIQQNVTFCARKKVGLGLFENISIDDFST